MDDSPSEFAGDGADIFGDDGSVAVKRFGFGEVVALKGVYAYFHKRKHFIFRLDAFCDDERPDATGESYKREGNLSLIAFVVDVADEPTVDFDDVGFDFWNSVEVGMPGSYVVQCYEKTPAFVGCDKCAQSFDVLDFGFDYFNDDIVGIYACAVCCFEQFSEPMVAWLMSEVLTLIETSKSRLLW